MTQAKRKLGRTDIEISPIGLGAWQFSNYRLGPFSTWQPMDPNTINEVVATALEHGINWFDTAELYGFGRSERALAAALQHIKQTNGTIRIATKWSPLLRTARSIERTIDRRLDALSPFAIDLYQIHFPAALSSIEAQMDAMAKLMKAGKIRSIGVSNFSASQMKRAEAQLQTHGLTLASNQVPYSLLNRRIESNGVLDTAKALGVTIIAYSPLEQGLLTGKFHDRPEQLESRPFNRRQSLRKGLETSRTLIDVMRPIAAAHSASLTQVALNWLIQVPGGNVVAIPGATKVHHVIDSAGAMSIALSKDEWEQLEVASRAFLN